MWTLCSHYIVWSSPFLNATTSVKTNIKLLPVHKLISAAVFLCLVSQNSTICFLPCHLLTHQVENTQWIGCYKFWFYSFGFFFVFFSWLLEIVADALNPNSLCYCAHYVVPVFFLSVSIRKHKPLLHPPVCPSRVIDLWFNPLYSKMKTNTHILHLQNFNWFLFCDDNK